MVVSLAKSDCLTKTAETRIKQMLGLEERKSFTTKVMEHGNYVEDEIYKAFKKSYSKMISNPYNKHDQLSTMLGFDIMNHIDLELETPKKLIWFEVKRTKATLEQTCKDYESQLQWHFIIGSNLAHQKTLEFELYVLHYCTDNTEEVFDIKRLKRAKIEQNADIAKLIVCGLQKVKLEVKRMMKNGN